MGEKRSFDESQGSWGEWRGVGASGGEHSGGERRGAEGSRGERKGAEESKINTELVDYQCS